MRPFVISPNQLKILFSPLSYFNCLISMIKNARQRLYLSSLYLSNDSFGQQIIKEIILNKKCNRALDCCLIFDKGRSERYDNGTNIIDILTPLTHYPNSTISFYQNPIIHLSVFNKLKTFKEIIGVYHTKIIISDDNILLTGANLSQSYFANRTDRYFVLQNCQMVSNYLSEYLNTIKSLSFDLKPNGRCYLNQKNQLVTSQLGKYSIKYNYTPIKYLPTDKILFYQTNQLKCCDIKNEEENLKDIMSKNKDECDRLVIHSGYCNLSQQFINKIGNTKAAIYTSAPTANSFYKGGLFKGQIPYLYRIYEKQILKFPNKNISLYEYSRPNWTFHNKGLWLYSKDGNPVITAIGSSNYNNRSFNRDLETQFYFLSNNSLFTSNLSKETELTAHYCNKLTRDDINNDNELKLKPHHYLFAKALKNYL